MRKMIRQLAAVLLALVLGTGLMSGFTDRVCAAESAVTFGSESYTAASGTAFKVGVYIKSDVTPGTYHVELAYDTSRMEYVSGADSENNGIILLEGTAASTEVKYMLNFTAVSGGTAGIYVKSAQVSDQAGTGEMEITAMAAAPITISGSDTSGTEAFSLEAEDGADAKPQEMQDLEDEYQVPLIGSAVDNAGNKLYIADLSAWEPTNVNGTFQKIEGEFDGEQVTFLTDQDKALRLLVLMDEQGQLSLYAADEDDALYPCVEETGFYYMSAKACSSWPADLTESMVEEEGIVYVLFDDGTTAFCKQEGSSLIPYNSDGEALADTEAGETASEADSQTPDTAESSQEKTDFLTELAEQYGYAKMAAGALVILLVLILLIIIIKSIRRHGRKKRAKKYVSTLPPEPDYVPIGGKYAQPAKQKSSDVEKALPKYRPAADSVRTESTRAAAEEDELSDQGFGPEIDADAAAVAMKAEKMKIAREELPVIAEPEEVLEEDTLSGISNPASAPAEVKEEPKPQAAPETSQTAAEEKPAVEETTAEEKPVVEEKPVTPAEPIVEEKSAAPAVPVVEEKPVAEEMFVTPAEPVVEEKPAAEEKTAAAAASAPKAAGSIVDRTPSEEEELIRRLFAGKRNEAQNSSGQSLAGKKAEKPKGSKFFGGKKAETPKVSEKPLAEKKTEIPKASEKPMAEKKAETPKVSEKPMAEKKAEPPKVSQKHSLEDTDSIVLPDIDFPDLDTDWNDDTDQMILSNMETKNAEKEDAEMDDFERQLMEALKKLNSKN